MFCLEILLWLCRGHFPGDLSSFFLFVLAVSTALCLSGATWLLYLALEPWIRRYWPQTIISWSRLLAGRTRDAVVGRDVLLGVILGVVWIFVFRIRDIRLMHLGGSPSFLSTEYLMGGRQALGRWLYQVPNSILGGLQFFFLLLGLKVLLRKQWIAVIVFVAIFTSLNALGSRHLSVEVPTVLIIYSIAAVVIVRFGLVAFICGIFTVDMLGNVPFSSDFSAWYMNTSLLALLSVVALAGWGFYYSLGGQPLWKSEVE